MQLNKMRLGRQAQTVFEEKSDLVYFQFCA